ncbi:MAG: hypothetical protein H7Y17_13435 [Chlorobia bacterium]|nr:hypothetical protein [Fimbriimonadaceae bacterium]
MSSSSSLRLVSGAKPIRFGEYDLFSDRDGPPDSIAPRLARLLDGKISDALIQVLMEECRTLAADEGVLIEDWRAGNAWLFQLARKFQKHLDADERKGMGYVLTPLALYFVELISDNYILPAGEVDWSDKDHVEIMFEAAWTKVRYAEGDELIDNALAKAKLDEVARLPRSLSIVVSMGYYLQSEGNGKSFFLPVNDKVADKLRVTKPYLGNLILAAIGRDYFKEIGPHIPNKRARTFKFNKTHADLFPKFKS